MTPLDLVERRMRELPTLPLVAQRVVGLLDNPSSSAADLEQVIKHDQALTARVLKLVNSAYYGYPRHITTVGQAIVILGYKTLKELVLSISIADLFRMRGEAKVFNRAALWQHAVVTAIGARILARRAGLPFEEDVFIAGLLHDIGVLFLDLCLNAEFDEIVALTTTAGVPLVRAEEKVLGFNHTQVGKMVAEKWNFPPFLVEVIRHHHRPVQTRNHWVAVALVFLADNLAQETGVGFLEGYDAGPDFVTTVWTWLELKPEQKPDVLQQIKRELQGAGEFLALC
ncbi:HDOD domain-containing protein [Capillibacterium thermochitinicola]|uniref:HDOD domain-containing protein n=1 Tax=Capillibacterium thermochitinicola TaxID=2699427 RepID=A0A8J6LNE7_9FIRM|nr:HDOD domain-containing protein [Capillibacterium thermochitinicola]MBA2133743.1 HDOD domain-containing protein [Capillibacterium thermochitinicola]